MSHPNLWAPSGGPGADLVLSFFDENLEDERGRLPVIAYTMKLGTSVNRLVFLDLLAGLPPLSGSRFQFPPHAMPR